MQAKKESNRGEEQVYNVMFYLNMEGFDITQADDDILSGITCYFLLL
jgi:hypothetical protein